MRFGDDDPVQWPQPYVAEACHLACIPTKPPKEVELSIMWWTPEYRDFVLDEHGLIRGVGKLNSTLLLKLELFCYKQTMRSRKEPFLHIPQAWQLSQTVEDVLHRLRHISSSFRQVQIGVRALQRFYLELLALLDYHEEYLPLMDGAHPDDGIEPSTASRIGVITYDFTVCARMHRAHIPVWLIRPYRTLPSILILSVVSIQHPSGLIVLEAASMPSYSAVYSGSVDALEAYLALKHRLSSFLSFPNPFASIRVENPVDAPVISLEAPSKRQERSKRYSPCEFPLGYFSAPI